MSAFVDIPHGRLYVAQAGQGRPLLFLHGFPLDHSMWREQIRDLSANHRVIAPDLRGFGRSSVTPGTQTMAAFAVDLAALLEALAINEPVVACGLSMGGCILWPLLERCRNHLAGLILCNTRAACDTPEAAAARRTAADRVVVEGPAFLADTMLPRLFSAETRAQRPDLVAEMRRVIEGAPVEGIAAAARGLAARPDVTPRLRQVDLPALVIAGTEDPISPPAEMRSMADAIPQATYVEVAGAAHMAPLEAPGPVNAAIAHFLQAIGH